MLHQSNRVENKFSSKQTQEGSWSRPSVMKGNGLLNKIHQKTWVMIFHNHSIFIKENKIYKDVISILNIYGTNTKAPTLVKEILLKLKLHIKSYTLIVIDLNTQISSTTGHPSKNKTGKKETNQYYESNGLRRYL